MSDSINTDIKLNLSEYESSILTGALEEFTYAVSEDYEADADTATYLRGLILDQTPEEWR